VTPIDERFAQLLRKSNKPVVLAANKCEGKQGDAGLMEAWRLGLGDPAPISAEHGEGMSDLYEGLAAAKAKIETAGLGLNLEPEVEAEEPFDPDAEAPPEPNKPIRIAFVGRPNAGKSTLLNGILNDDRFITGPEAGITRDSVTVAWHWRDKEIRLVDTAGLRKRAKVQEKLERLSTMETTHSIRFADVVVLVMDPRDAFEKQDVQIANLVLREGRGLVYAITKWDTVDNPAEARKEMEHQATAHIPHAAGTPVVPVSGITRKNLDKLMDACVKVHKDWSARIKTRDLNDWLQYVTQKHPPPAPDGKRIKPRYMAQMKTRPPTFVLMASRAEMMPETYKRYLLNEMREAFDLPGVPIRLVLRQNKNPFDEKE
jgi:GTP-binding protein